MEKNTAMVLVVALIVVAVISITALVLVFGGKPGAPSPTYSGGSSSPGGPGSYSPPSSSASNAIICEASLSGYYSGEYVSMTGTTKIEKPGKMRSDMSMYAAGESVTIKLRLNGNVMYYYDSSQGSIWIRMDVSESGQSSMLDASWAQIGNKTPDQMAAEMASGIQANVGITPTVTCRYSGDIPDSEFSLPAGESSTTLEEFNSWTGTGY
jgi:hypothetical protein